MFSIGFFELLLIAVVGLLIFGPEKLPDAIRTFATGFSKFKRSLNKTKRELEQELGMEEIREEIRKAAALEHLEALKSKSAETNRIPDKDDPSKAQESEQLSESASDGFSSTSSDKSHEAVNVQIGEDLIDADLPSETTKPTK